MVGHPGEQNVNFSTICFRKGVNEIASRRGPIRKRHRQNRKSRPTVLRLPHRNGAGCVQPSQTLIYKLTPGKLREIFGLWSFFGASNKQKNRRQPEKLT